MKKDFIPYQKLRDFGLTLSFGIPLIIGFLIPLIHGQGFRFWTLFFAAFFFISSILYPKLLNFPFRAWIKLGYLLGWINSRLILTLIFFIILLPIAAFMKLFGYDPLKRDFTNQITYKENKLNYKVDLRRIF